MGAQTNRVTSMPERLLNEISLTRSYVLAPDCDIMQTTPSLFDTDVQRLAEDPNGHDMMRLLGFCAIFCTVCA